jgi:hypothetical protein
MIVFRELTLFLTFSFALMCFASCDSERSEAESLKEFVSKVNKKCPAMLDSETQFDGIEIKNGEVLRYNYTLVNVFVENVDKSQFYKDLWPGLLSDIKISSQMKNLRDKKITVEYYYQDKVSNPIYTFTISPEDYLTE